MRFDHVALAVSDAKPVIDVLVGRLGATVLFGRATEGFRWVLLRVGDASGGMELELLEPWESDRTGFLTRFLKRHGDGPHHITYKLDDLEAQLERLEAAGYRLIGVSLSDPVWKEAFLHPKEAHGVLVQLVESKIKWPPMADILAAAQVEGGRREELDRLAGGFGSSDPWWAAPPPRSSTAVKLRSVVIATRSLASARLLFEDLLGGRTFDEAPKSVTLGWRNGRQLRLEERADRTPGIDRLETQSSDGHEEQEIGGIRFALHPG